MRRGVSFLALSAMIFAISCSPVSVSHDYDPDINFGRLKTFDWIPFPGNVEVNQLVVKRIQDAVTRGLQAKGLQKSSQNPDFVIVMHGMTEDKLDITDWGYSTGSYYRGGYWGGGHNISVNEYTEGTLTLDFIDSKSKQLLWRGVAKGTVDPNATPQKRTQRINDAVAKLLEQFPPVPST